MTFQNQTVADAAAALQARLPELKDPAEILRAPELKALYDQLRTLPADQKASFGQRSKSAASGTAAGGGCSQGPGAGFAANRHNGAV